MKRLFDFLMRKYCFGLKWYASSGIEEELIAQVFYIQALICGLRILYQMDPQKILGYITFTIFHILSMYILGYLSSLWELDPKEEIFTNTYRTVNIVLAIGSILAKVPCYILLIVGATICGFASFILMEKIDDFEKARYSLQINQMKGIEVSKEEQDKLEQKYMEMMKEPKIKEYFDAEMRFNVLLTDVNKIIAEAVKEVL